MSNDDNNVSASFEAEVQIAESHFSDTVIQFRDEHHEDVVDHEDVLLVEALSILKGRAKKYGHFFRSVEDSALYFMLDLAELEKEVFKVAYLNKKHQLIEVETLAIGTIDSATVSIREIAKLALQYNASTVLLAHNHPSGNPSPSHSDREFTRKVIKALDLFEINVLDHIVVADDQYHSMNANFDVDFKSVNTEKSGSQKIS